MTASVIHRITSLDLVMETWPWPFALTRRAEIDAHFALKLREKPAMWNGRVLLGRNPVFAGERFSASYFETDFASFLAWRDWGFPYKEIFNGFGMGALRCSDGAFVMGEMRMDFSAEDFLLSFSMPNLYFHAATAYDILRAQGLPLGKRDFMGAPRVKR